MNICWNPGINSGDSGIRTAVKVHCHLFLTFTFGVSVCCRDCKFLPLLSTTIWVRHNIEDSTKTICCTSSLCRPHHWPIIATGHYRYARFWRSDSPHIAAIHIFLVTRLLPLQTAKSRNHGTEKVVQGCNSYHYHYFRRYGGCLFLSVFIRFNLRASVL